MKIYDYSGNRNICGRRVKKARQIQKLSQSELAARLQTENVIMEQKTISRLELGHRFVTDYELLALSRVLNVDVGWLLKE